VRKVITPILGLLALAACAPPTPQAIYAPYLESHRWMYATRTTGPGREEYRDHILVESQPLSNRRSLFKIHIAPNPNDPRVGARQKYVLDLSKTPPRLESLETEGGTARFDPGFFLPALEVAEGKAVAQYAADHGFLRGRAMNLSWKYAPFAGGLVSTPAGNFFVSGVDMEFRTSLKLTDANMRLEFAAGAGLVYAEWKTNYGTSTSFTLESFK
jgi:hypothetical protein